jgi:predicted nucleic acid-binding protein
MGNDDNMRPENTRRLRVGRRGPDTEVQDTAVLLKRIQASEQKISQLNESIKKLETVLGMCLQVLSDVGDAALLSKTSLISGHSAKQVMEEFTTAIEVFSCQTTIQRETSRWHPELYEKLANGEFTLSHD